MFFFSQLLQTGLGYGALDAGLRLLPWTATFLVIAPIAGTLADRIGERPLMVTGLLIQTGALCWIALIADPSLAYAELVVPMVLGRVGISMAIPAAQNSVVGAVALDAVGKAAGTNSMMRELGGVFGIAVTVAIFATAGGYASPQAFTDGFAPAMVAAAALALLGALAGTALPGRRRPPPPSRVRGDTMTRVMVRYKVAPEQVARNEELVRAVYEELRRTAPDGLRYATFKLPDGVTFIHLADRDGAGNPLTELAAFKAFQAGLRERCDEPPVVSELSEVGSFAWD